MDDFSAQNKENITKKSANMLWYSGQTLQEALSAFNLPRNSKDKALRIAINRTYCKESGAVAAGKIVSGTLRVGMNVSIASCGLCMSSEVTSTKIHKNAVSEAAEGDIVGLHLPGIPASLVKRGHVVSNPLHNPCNQVEHFTAKITICKHPGKIKEGYTPLVCCHTGSIPCVFKKFHSKFDGNTGSTVEENPAFLVAGDGAFVDLWPLKALCVEMVDDFPLLGRLVILDGYLVGFGEVVSLVPLHSGFRTKPAN